MKHLRTLNALKADRFDEELLIAFKIIVMNLSNKRKINHIFKSKKL